MAGICAGKCTSKARLDGKTVVVTGCNTGIGKVCVEDFYRRGGRVIMACRSLDKAEQAKEEIEKKAKGESGLGQIVVRQLDLSSLNSVRTFAKQMMEEEARIDILLNNAGIMMCPLSRTEEGFEMQVGTNHLGHYALTLLLLPRILKSTPARIVNVSSLAHNFGDIDFEDLNWNKRAYSSTAAYGQSKLANILFTKELARRLQGKDVNVYSLHPGAIATDLTRNLDQTYFRGAQAITNLFAKLFFKTPVQGAQTNIYCCVDEVAGKETGLYYSDCKVKQPHRKATDMETAKKLWDISWQLTKLSPADTEGVVL